jgi:hypothetical protein
MKKHQVVLLCAGLVVVAFGIFRTSPTSAVYAQGKTHVEVKTEAARPEDVSSPEAIVQADLASISGGVGVARQWGRDSSLMDPHVRFVSISVDPRTGKTKTHAVTQQEFIDESDAFMVKEGFTEHELGHQVHRYGNVATVLSAYEGKTAAGKPERGVNIYQLYNDGKRWWIASIVWDEEREGNPIPVELLGK